MNTRYLVVLRQLILMGGKPPVVIVVEVGVEERVVEYFPASRSNSSVIVEK